MPREYYLLPSLRRPCTRNVEFETGWISTRTPTLFHMVALLSVYYLPQTLEMESLEFVSEFGSGFGSEFGVRVLGSESGVEFAASVWSLGESLESG